MPVNLTGNPDHFPPQRAIKAGESRTAASMKDCLQDSADRTEHVKERLDFIQKDGEGVRRIRSAPSLEALAALTDRPDMTICMVAPFGIYSFDAASSLEELHPLVVKPTGIAPSARGRWVICGRGLLNVPNGLAQLDANGKLRVAQLDGAVDGKLDGAFIRNGLIDQVLLDVPSGSFTVAADNTWRDVTDCQVKTSDRVRVGDTLSCQLAVSVAPAQENLTTSVRLVLVRPDGSVEARGPFTQVGIYVTNRLNLAMHPAALQDGVHVIKAQARGANGNPSSFTVSDFNGLVEVFRR